ncbi:hypothetical protein F8388_009075 [Cannabis sativa]|uniref:Retrotransposon Copia-like N-terminal domain-containing protein n=1 Tax=Cannabis sativa TaxID=3483 RepID=A0A7J6GJE1_CANSA|nr:hypothetical protein F8388_009075 [Cannabis sativa]
MKHKPMLMKTTLLLVKQSCNAVPKGWPKTLDAPVDINFFGIKPEKVIMGLNSFFFFFVFDISSGAKPAEANAMSTGDSQTPQRGERHTGAEHLSSPQVTNGSSQQGVHFGSGGFSNVPFGNTLTQPFSIKLDRNNYTLWRNLVSTIIRGHRLEGYVNGTKPCPTEFVGAPGNGENTPGSTQPSRTPASEHSQPNSNFDPTVDSNHSQQSQATSPCDMPGSSHTDQSLEMI